MDHTAPAPHDAPYQLSDLANLVRVREYTAKQARDKAQLAYAASLARSDTFAMDRTRRTDSSIAAFASGWMRWPD